MIRLLLRRLAGGLVGHAAIYIVAAALNAAIPFVLLPLIARWLGPADFGVIGSFVAIANVLILLIGLNAYGFVSVGFYRDGAESLRHLTGAAVIVIMAASLVVGITGAVGAGVIERFAGIDRRWLWTLLAAAAGQAVIAVGLTAAQTLRRPLIYAAIQIGYGLFLALLALVLIGVAGMGWQGRVLAQAVAALSVAAGALLWLGGTGRITLRVGREPLMQVLRFGLLLLPHSFAAVAMGSMDRLALGGRFGSLVVGQYFLALQIASVFIAFAAAVNQAWVPWLYERLSRGDNSSRGEIGRAIRVGGTLLVTAASALALLAGPIVLLVGGAAYAPASLSLRFLAFHAAGQAWYTLMSAFLFYAHRNKLLSVLTVSTALLQAALVALLVPFGATGVAAGLAATSCIAATVMSFVARSVTADVGRGSIRLAATLDVDSLNATTPTPAGRE